MLIGPGGERAAPPLPKPHPAPQSSSGSRGTFTPATSSTSSNSGATSAPAETTESAQRFNQAVQQALAARAQAEGQPAWTSARQHAANRKRATMPRSATRT